MMQGSGEKACDACVELHSSRNCSKKCKSASEPEDIANQEGRNCAEQYEVTSQSKDDIASK